MKKKPPLRKRLIKRLDVLWSLAIRAKYPRCVVCGKEPTQAHHAIVRKAQTMGVRWLPKNGIGLCYVCHIHRLHGQAGDKQFLDKYIEILNQEIPAEEQLNIQQISHQITKFSVSDLQELVIEFESRGTK